MMEGKGLAEEIVFDAYYGDDRRRVAIYTPNGGGGGYHITIGGFYQGSIKMRGGQWIGNFNRRSEITGADIDILGDIVLEALRMA